MRRMFRFPFIVLAVAVFSAVVMLLWNAIIPDLFKLGTITYWQALGLLVLSKILFGGWHGPHHRWHRHHHMWREQWMGMSEEEKAKYREEWKSRWCCGEASAETPKR
jgi:Ca2+/H+ antiporter, TMEM165/GDT1 family